MTRLPVPVNGTEAKKRGAAAAWAWPLAGAVVGALAGLLLWAALWLGLPPLAAGLLAVGAQIVLTGALHEDGLADSADGLWGGWTRDRRLEIMRDSRIGSYGVLALILSVGLRAAACAALPAGPLAVAALAGTGAASRAAMAGVMAGLPPARTDGLSVSTGRPSAATALTALAAALALALIVLPIGTALAAVAACCAGAGLVAGIASAKIGGQTGDILGAAQQIAEIAALLALATLL
ncbi:MAG: adenosylcobinamide-GDP ribazoletransferase [Pseudomonadota bacterium]